MGKYYSIAVGMHKSSGFKSLLIAPDGYLISPGDVIATDRGAYTLTYTRNHVTDEFPEVIALKAALENEPLRITKRLTEEIFDWGSDHVDE